MLLRVILGSLGLPEEGGAVVLCITRQKLVSAGSSCSKHQGKCKLCTKAAGKTGKGRWNKLVALARQG